MALGESADDIRSVAGTGEGDSGADVTKRDGKDFEAGSVSERARLTGWEAERGIWLETERARRIQAQAQIKSSQVDSDLAVSIDSVVGGVTAVASMIEDEPTDDTEYAREHTDSKALAEERERKEAHGIHMG